MSSLPPEALVNMGGLLGVGGVMWYVLKSLRSDLSESTKRMHDRIDRLYEKLDSMNGSRIRGLEEQLDHRSKRYHDLEGRTRALEILVEKHIASTGGER